MSQNIGTLVSAAIRPNDSLDPIATAYSNEIKGSLHSYQTLNDVYLIITSRRQWGMLACVYDDDPNNGIYQLKYNYLNSDINNNGNWVKTAIDKNILTEWVDSVISILLVEPTSPTLGDRYLLGVTSSISPIGSQWDSITATNIVEYNSNGSWDITNPVNGMTVRIDSDNNGIYKYDGTFPNGEWKLEKVTNVFYISPISVNGVTYSTTTSPTFNTYTNDLIFLAKFNIPTSGSASLNINGIGYKGIKIATTGGLRDLLVGDIDTTSIYSLSYNGTYFQLTKPFATDAHNIEFYISAGETMLVQDYEQYWVYGDLTVAGTLVNYGKVVIANGSLILEGTGILDNQGDGEVILVDLFNTPIFNNSSTIELSSELTVNGPSFSAAIIDNSITTNLLNAINGPTASYLLSTDGAGSFQWTSPGTSTYKVYSALLSQSGTASPSAIILENTLGINVSWLYTNIGSYTLLADSSLFEQGKVQLIQGSGNTSNLVSLWGYYNSSTEFIIDNYDLGNVGSIYSNVGQSWVDGIMQDQFIEIRVYN